VRHCRYPTNVNSDTSDLSYCTIYGTGLPQEGMSSKAFMRDCDAQEKLMVGPEPFCLEGGDLCTTAAHRDVSFAQLFAVNPEAPQQDSDLLPSNKNMVKEHARVLLESESTSQGLMAPVLDDLEPPPVETEEGACDYAPGSMIEAIQGYASACEDNNNMRMATLMVSTLFLLNIVELLALVQVSSGVHVFQR
jgi:hypothetical protein